MRVLLLSTTTGYQLRSFGEAAARLGIELVLATDRCHHLDDPWRDGAIPVRFHDEEASFEAVVSASRQDPLDGVIAVGDRPTVLAARVSMALGLPGHPVQAAAAARSKHAMRRAFNAARMRTPWFFDLHADADVRQFARQLAYPCVVKPLGLSGSRGVIKAGSPREFEAAVARVRALLARTDVRALRTGLTDALLVEGYLEGREYAVEGLVSAGRLRVLAVFEKPDPLDGPFFEETIYVTSAEAGGADRRAIADEVQRAVTALGLTHGPVHAECRVGPQGVTMLEVAARPIGGLCSKVLRFTEEGTLTVPLEDLLLRHAVGGETSRCVREPQAAGVMMIPIPRGGVYKGVEGEEEARRVAHIEEVRITAKRDQRLEPLPEGDSYLGFIFARGPQPETVVDALRAAHRHLNLQIKNLELRIQNF